ncbi:MAG: hypothetical protein HKN56_06745 [Gammaproteobacteria bacterium]|nr:hypothetical protein [Gammaproteobacteria bacterium]
MWEQNSQFRLRKTIHRRKPATGLALRLTPVVMLIALVTVLATVGIVYTLKYANTVSVTFAYQRATEREDGTPLPLEEIKYTRLFCDGQQVGEEPGADGEITVRLEKGSHTCFLIHVDTTGLQSARGNAVKRHVEAGAG